jgi:photosystem II stability/assembly factor-like uncharacterized protein
MATVSLAMDTAILTAAEQGGGEWRTVWITVSERLECVAASPGRQFAGGSYGSICRSTDGGETWPAVASMADRVTAVTVSPHDPDVVWAGTEPSSLYRSVDGGETWTERPGLADLPSADRWSFPLRPDTHHVRWIAEDPHEPGQLYLAIEAGAFVRSPDGGLTYHDHPAGARRDNHTIAIHPDAPGRVCVAAGDGYAESPDGGDTWMYPQNGLEHRYVWGLALSPADPDEVFVSAASGAFAAHDPDGTAYIYRRDGDSWERSMDGLAGPEGVGRAVLATGPDRIYAATNRGLFARGDGRWESLPVDWPAAREDELPRGLAVVS